MPKNYLIVGGSRGLEKPSLVILSNEGHRMFSFSRTEGDLPASENISFHEYDVTGPGPLPNLNEKLHGLAYLLEFSNLKPFQRLTDNDLR
jgi:hypothetical protein